MNHFVMLMRLTDAGAEKADRLQDLMHGVVEVWNTIGSGAEVYATTGEFDLVAHGDLDSDVDAAWLGAHLAMNGVKTCSLRAFREDEIRSAFEERPFEMKYPVRW